MQKPQQLLQPNQSQVEQWLFYKTSLVQLSSPPVFPNKRDLDHRHQFDRKTVLK